MKFLFENIALRNLKPVFSEEKIERSLTGFFIVFFLILMLVQIVFHFPGLSSVFLKNRDMEGALLGVEEYLYEEGELVVEILGEESREDIHVLLNGSFAGSFDNKFVVLKVKNGDIVEIDASSSGEGKIVAIRKVSENLDSALLSKQVATKKGVSILAKVRMK
ncbi:MAG TPA: hypothetical protein GXX49_08815 [Clostridiaceae bacterium]|nr:hypothetical protein [Clostridiaceae bacterium]